MTIDYWKTEAVKVIQFSNKPVLDGIGSMSHETMKTIVGKTYNSFDSDRKKLEALQADREEDEAIQKLILASKKKP